VHCRNCGFDNREGARFCVECASELKNSCPKCGSDNPPRARFCEQCAVPLSEAAATATDHRRARDARTGGDAGSTAPPLAAAAPEGERKTITALFADIKGSMELMEDLDPEEARAIIDPALELMMEAVRHYGGNVAQSTGDGIFALFGAPIAHEDHPQRALYAALRMQEEMRRYDEKLRLQQGVDLKVRVGINTGEVVVRSVRRDESHADYLPVGHSTGLAQRMQTLAAPGAVVVTEHTRKLVEGYFQLRPLGPTKIKGLTDPIGVYEVAGRGALRTRLQASAQRGLSKFVGRDTEIERLVEALNEAKAGRGQVVAVVAEPGVGKSRLFYEFRLRSGSGCKVLEAFSVSYGKAAAYLPVIELLKGYLEISPEDDPRRRLEKINGKVLTLDRAFENDLPFLYPLLAVVPEDGADRQLSPPERANSEASRRRTIDAIRHLLIRESLKQPLIVVFEDLHWIDTETQALLDALVEDAATARILLLVNYRPEYRNNWSVRGHFSEIALSALGLESADTLLAELLGNHSSVASAKALVAEKTEGNPFFMEEIVQTMFEQGALKRNGEVVLALSLASVVIPATVQALLASRIDRLGHLEKETLQTASVIGRQFSPAVLRKVNGQSAEDIEKILASLQNAEFIYEQPSFPEPDYLFKHALTQEVTYGSILNERRRELHGRAAEAIESLYGDRLEDRYAELANHYERARNARKAVDYLILAAQQADGRSAFLQEADCASTAQSLISELPPGRDRSQKEALVLTAAGSALMALRGGGAPELGNVYSRLAELWTELGDRPRLIGALIGLHWTYNMHGETAKARRAGEEAMALAEAAGDRNALSYAHYALGNTLSVAGEHRASLEHFKRAVADSTHMLLPRMHSAISLWVLGYPQRAVEQVRLGLRRAHQVPAAPRAYALQGVPALYQMRREPRAALEAAEAGLALATEYGISLAAAICTIARGWALGMVGGAEEGIAEIRRGIAAYVSLGAATRPQHLNQLAELFAKGGRAKDGLQILDESIALISATGYRSFESEALGLKGELTLIVDPAAESEALACFERAIDVARSQEAKSWELRATMSLGRLLAKRGKGNEARAMLAEIYNWFTEGFDTADLKDAKALLGELSG
jgi:class 3 adenylate cyclase